MIKQRTLNNSFELAGIGLHSGLKVNIRFNPAPDNYGYKIRRTDILGHPTITAIAENVVNTQRGTVLAQHGVQVSTVEHALAALYACEIDNCLIEIDGPEFPILDGSSILYVSKIKETGLQEQSLERKYVSFSRRKIKVVDKASGSSMLLLPDDTFSIETQIIFDSPFLKRQEATMNSFSEFAKEIAPARTFVFVREIESLLKNNLVKGGSLDNAIVIYDHPLGQEKVDKLSELMSTKTRDASRLGYIMNRPLSYSNEPARHKLLDVIGDIALVGFFIKGKIIANCPGHQINNLFARAIREAISADNKLNSYIVDKNILNTKYIKTNCHNPLSVSS